MAVKPEESHLGVLTLPRYAFCPVCGGRLAPRQIKRGDRERLVCSRCAFVYYRNPKVTAATVFQHRGELVLGRRAIEPGYGKWIFPGGYVDIGETVEQAARRETREEMGVTVTIAGLLGVYSYVDLPAVIIVFAAEISAGEPRAADEILEVASFAAADIPWNDLAFPSTREVVRDYVRGYMAPATSPEPARE